MGLPLYAGRPLKLTGESKDGAGVKQATTAAAQHLEFAVKAEGARR